MRVALVHDWLFQMRGGERVLEELVRLFPEATVHVLFHRPGRLSPILEAVPKRASHLNRLPMVDHYYRYLLPLYPLAVRSLKVSSDADLVISSSHCAAKAVPVPEGVPHVCYCHTPARYLWGHGSDYFGKAHGLLRPLLDRLRSWDLATSDTVTLFLANSHTVRDRIRAWYGRRAIVVPPPVDVEFYRPLGVGRESFFLAASAFVPYKRLDLAIRACERLRRRLVVVGDGPERRRLQRLAGRWTTFVGWVDESELRRLYNRCRGLIFPALEDFGIIPVEAQACGAPVIAYGKGGATETVVPPEAGVQPTGVWFEEQTVESLCAAIERFERLERWFDPAALRANALRFSRHRFREAMKRVVTAVLNGRIERLFDGFAAAAVRRAA